MRAGEAGFNIQTFKDASRPKAGLDIQTPKVRGM
jgi:hypothetical protein